MRIIIEVGELDSIDAIFDMKEYVNALQREIERRRYLGQPGAWLEYGPHGGVWAKSVRLDA